MQIAKMFFCNISPKTLEFSRTNEDDLLAIWTQITIQFVHCKQDSSNRPCAKVVFRRTQKLLSGAHAAGTRRLRNGAAIWWIFCSKSYVILLWYGFGLQIWMHRPKIKNKKRSSSQNLSLLDHVHLICPAVS